MKSSSLIVVVLSAWFGLATTAILLGALQRVFPPVVLMTLLATCLILVATVRSLRESLMRMNLKLLLLPHLIRFVGLAFLVMVNRGVLPEEFRSIGWGDLIAAIGASILLLGPPVATGRWRSAWIAWNAFGLTDMLILLGTAVRLGTRAPQAFEIFRHLPMGLLPTFFVPLIITSHLVIFARLLRRDRSPAPPVES